MKNILLIAFAVFVASATVALAGSTDHGRRLTGPFCVGVPNLAPVFVNGEKVSRAGAVRSVAVNEKCQPTEVRRFGVAVPDPDNRRGLPAPGPAGAKGDKGAKGDPGVAGATGAQGAKGDAGAAGAKGDAGAQGATGSAGAKGETGATGATGPAGAQGEAGAQGAQGIPGPAGHDGANGLGDGYRWLCEDGGTGHGMADGGTGVNPDCNNGTKLAFKVVTVGAEVDYK